jgi:multiple sugar transport system permease protein
MNTKSKERISRIFFLILPLSLLLFLTLAPFYWIINVSLKSGTEIFAKPITYWPKDITIENYINLFTNLHFETYFFNSFIVAMSVTILVCIMALIGGYAMSRYKFKGKTFVYILLLCTQMFPAVVLMIPLFETMNNLHLINDLKSLIIVCTCTLLPYCMFMMMGYYNAVPRTLEEAAQIDGCSLLGAVFKILIPAMRPSIVAIGAYAFINSWNVYVYASAFITDKSKYTMPLALSLFQGEAQTNYGGLAAACVVGLIPALLLFALIQKNLAGGTTSGAVKG